MPSIARVAYIPLRALAVNVIAIYSRSRRKRRKPDSTTPVQLLVEPIYNRDELTDLGRTMLRYARSFLREAKHNQHLQIAVSLRRPLQERDVVARSRSDRVLIRLIGVTLPCARLSGLP